jgi:tRNA(Leu) C34 or U34 (ribose-2'-O)-methylase TrmL
MNKGVATLCLWEPKFPENVGSIIRAAVSFGNVGLIVIFGNRGNSTYNSFIRHCSDTTKGFDKIPIIKTSKLENLFELIPFNSIPIGIELNENSINLMNFCHPKNAFYIFGAEDGGVPTHVLEKCKHIVQIPSELCLNVAASANIVLYDRVVKAAKGITYYERF